MGKLEEALHHVEKAIDEHPKPAAGVHAERAHRHLLDAPDSDEFEHSDEWGDALTGASNACRVYMEGRDEFYAGVGLGSAESNLKELVDNE